jgi:hypothetical protein
VLTYRDDELGDDHPLRRVLGALASSEVRRLTLQPLSPRAVEELSGGLLERAWGTATRTNSVQPIALAGIARVEAAWLPATTGPPPSWPGSRWSAPPAGGPSATTASCCATWPAAGTR